jgi:hypothetical protein
MREKGVSMEMSDNKINGKYRFQPGNKNSKGRPKGSRNRVKVPTQEDIVMITEKIYQSAIDNNKLGIALQTLTLQARILGMLPTRKLLNKASQRDVKKDKLGNLIEFLKKTRQS